MNDLRIKEIAKSKGITITELSERLGITQITLSRNINGNPTLETLRKIATTLGVSVKELFEDDPDNFITLYRKDDKGDFVEFGQVRKL